MKFWRNFGQLCHLMANISGIQQDIIRQRQKTALQTMDTPALANLIWCTLVFAPQTGKKWDRSSDSPIVQRPGVSESVAFAGWRYWPTQWAAITLGIATHSNLWLYYSSVRICATVWRRVSVVNPLPANPQTTMLLIFYIFWALYCVHFLGFFTSPLTILTLNLWLKALS